MDMESKNLVNSTTCIQIDATEVSRKDHLS